MAFDEAYMARLYDYYDNKGSYNGEPLQTKGWTTGVLTDMAMDFMKDHREVPFFAYLPYLTCHAPLDAPGHYVEKYLEKGLSENLATLYGMVEHLGERYQISTVCTPARTFCTQGGRQACRCG